MWQKLHGQKSKLLLDRISFKFLSIDFLWVYAFAQDGTRSASPLVSNRVKVCKEYFDWLNICEAGMQRAVGESWMER